MNDDSTSLPKPGRAWYASNIEEFIRSDLDSILGKLTSNSDFAVLPSQRDAWLAQIEILQKHTNSLSGSIFMEYSIPRMGRRIDTVLIVGPIVFVIEFKVGQLSSDRAGIDQVWDYALDLKNFHAASHNAAIVPILIVTGAARSQQFDLDVDDDMVFRPVSIHHADLPSVLEAALSLVPNRLLDANMWSQAPYSPSPTIIEAARSLYAQHSVEGITRCDSGARNLAITSNRINEIVEHARENGRKAICFVTGVPGAGKTLAGLNIATQRRDISESTHAIFLSGNGPLVAVLREALARDEVHRLKTQGIKARKAQVEERIKAFIQNIHHFRDDLLATARPPVEHIAIFDEAQRAWTKDQTAKFMNRKRNIPDFAQSEPEFLISGMDRHQDWAVIICLVGGGQEINTGEAGIVSWISSIESNFHHWDVHISSQLTDSEYGSVDGFASVRNRCNTFFDDSLHLSVSLRSFRAENVSTFVKSLLDCDKQTAMHSLSNFSEVYPIVVCRDLHRAKQWIREQARGSERYGLVASSEASRLKPDGIDIRIEVNPVHWFLNERTDTRSSYYLEDAATEFQVQGLELDWTCVAWDADLRIDNSRWSYHSFRGVNWCSIGNLDNQKYLCNAYRVLLTRARQGMVIFIPRGDENDPTRLPSYYDATHQYLVELGIPELK